MPSTELDTYLDELNKEFNKTLYPLWIMDYDYRTQFELANSSYDEQSWWKLIRVYQHCLYSVGIYVTEMRLSRKIHQKLVVQNLEPEKQLKLASFPNEDNFIIISKWSTQFQELNGHWIDRKNHIKSKIVNLFQNSLEELTQISVSIKGKADSIYEKEKRKLNIRQRKLQTRIRLSVNKLLILGFEQVWQEIVNIICDPNLFIIRNLLDIIVGLASQGYTDAINQLWEHYQISEVAMEESSEYMRAILLESFRFLPILELADWQLIFNSSIAANSDIEKLKATETWLYLGNLAKPFVQPEYFQNIANALKSVPAPLARLKKNYILILGMYNYDLPDNIPFSDEEKNDYLIQDALKLAESGKVSEIFTEIEPARVRQYYNQNQKSVNKDKHYSL